VAHSPELVEIETETTAAEGFSRIDQIDHRFPTYGNLTILPAVMTVWILFNP
jgi:hypothetical protein